MIKCLSPVYRSKYNNNCNSFLKFASRNYASVQGFASPDGTKQFITNNRLPLYHIFNSCGLTINPVIFGPPKGIYAPSQFIDSTISDCVTIKGINAYYIYSHNPTGNWYTDSFSKMIHDNIIKRENIIAIADLGIISETKQVIERMIEASNASKFETLDAITFKVIQYSCFLLKFIIYL